MASAGSTLTGSMPTAAGTNADVVATAAVDDAYVRARCAAAGSDTCRRFAPDSPPPSSCTPSSPVSAASVRGGATGAANVVGAPPDADAATPHECDANSVPHVGGACSDKADSPRRSRRVVVPLSSRRNERVASRTAATGAEKAEVGMMASATVC